MFGSDPEFDHMHAQGMASPRKHRAKMKENWPAERCIWAFVNITTVVFDSDSVRLKMKKVALRNMDQSFLHKGSPSRPTQR